MGERRVVIYGNAGSGKTTMARRLGLPVLSLDDVAWAAVGVCAPLPDSLAALEQFLAAHPEWVIEGCYGDLIAAAAARCTELRFLTRGVTLLLFHHRAFLARLWLQGGSGAPGLRDLDDPLGPPPWRWTDDTAMALAIVTTLRDHAGIDQDQLARAFATQYAADPRRGYGPARHTLLPQLRRPAAWQTAPGRLFGGRGSFGNGAPMRVAPVGAYFADDLEAAVEHAGRSAVLTHDAVRPLVRRGPPG
jgi:hypothetical protein